MTTPVPLDGDRLRKRLVDDGPYAALDVVTVTGSTNTDLVGAANAGAADRTVLIAEEQQAGRGRMQRSWVSPRCYGLHVSVLLRPVAGAQSALSWLPLVAGIALTETVRECTALRATVKWPNDLLLGESPGRKAAGILAEGVTTLDGMAVVLGIGVNVHHDVDSLPAGAGGLPATSLAAEGADVDREDFAARLLASFAEAEQVWREHAASAGNPLRARYERLCGTLGQRVRVELGGGRFLHGVAKEVDAHGRLVVRGSDGDRTAVSAGDVVHLRPE